MSVRSLALGAACALGSAASFLAASPPPAHAATCSGSTTTNIRGKTVDLDQCYRTTVARGSTTYTITVFYTEQNTSANTARCTTAENTAGRCEHALANNDDANGDNRNAVLLGTEMATALGFYLDRGLGFPRTGSTALTVAIGEDPRGGGINPPMGIFVDDEWIDQNDPLAKRLLSFHEMMHLIQDVWDDGGVGWQGFYGEGIARAIEDRVDTTLDADTGHLFIPELNGLMSTDSDRTSSVESNSYRTFLWWTWLFDQYRAGGDTEPRIGWTAIRDFYTTLGASSDQVQAIRDFITSRGGTFTKDWLDYTLSLWAYRRSPANPRLTYLDSEIRSAGNALSGHTTITGGPAFAATQTTPSVNARSVQFFELNPATQCDYASFSFDGQGKTFGFSALTATASGLRDRWSSISTTWTRTVRTAGLTSIVGAVTGLDQTGPVRVGWGCVQPTLALQRPTTAAFEMIGQPASPRRFIAQVKVTGPSGEAIAGLAASAFTVRLIPAGGGTALNATVVQGAYVQDTYWLLISPPNGAAGAVGGQFYDLRIALGTRTATQPSSLLYADRKRDVITVLDRSGSMADASKIAAARNAATLLTDELAATDRGGYVSFNHDATLDQPLATMTAAHRSAMEGAIGGAVATGATSIGDGMATAAAEQDAKKDPTRACGFVLLSDGYENAPRFWADVRADVIRNGCAIHSIALGPEANEPLMQAIAAAVPGGSYDYADVGGGVPVGSSGTAGAGAGGTGGSPGAAATFGWADNLSRLYDVKASKLAGRQRILSAAGIGDEGCRKEDAIVGFEHQIVGTRLVEGDAFADGATKVGVEHLFDQGAVVFGGNRAAGGAGTEALLGGVALQFDFAPGCEVQFRYRLGKNAVRLFLNGEPISFDSFLALDGHDLGGVRMRVFPDDPKGMSGTVVLTGDIERFGIAGGDLAIDEVVHRVKGEGRPFYVDPSATQLVLAVAWQQPTTGQTVRIVAPNGTVVPVGRRQLSGSRTNEVWRIPNPAPGRWTVAVDGLDQPFLTSVTAITQLELRLATPTPIGGARVGASVPLVALVSSLNGPVRRARVVATVTDPNGRQENVALLDDGSHGDGDANDGVYGGTYRATGRGDIADDKHGDIGENQGPVAAGSYSVHAVATISRNRREDDASFALVAEPDSDGDGMPDVWEKRFGSDPGTADAMSDGDRDGLANLCELRLGTDPRVDDTDGGGTADGGEAVVVGGECYATTDPLAADDPIGPLASVGATPEATGGAPRIALHWGDPKGGTLRAVRIERREGSGPWTVLRVVGGSSFDDTTVVDGTAYAYRITPAVAGPGGRLVLGQALVTPETPASADPYAPYGSIVVNGGAASTRSRIVRLSLIAEDAEGDSEHGAHAGALTIGTPVDQLQMRISNRRDFRGAPWRAFRPTLGWRLPAVTRATRLRVFVQYRDLAGNVSEEDTQTSDVIVLRP